MFYKLGQNLSNFFVLQGSDEDALMAYQIAFDMYESATQQFLNNVVQAIRRSAPVPEEIKGNLTEYQILPWQSEEKQLIAI